MDEETREAIFSILGPSKPKPIPRPRSRVEAAKERLDAEDRAKRVYTAFSRLAEASAPKEEFKEASFAPYIHGRTESYSTLGDIGVVANTSGETAILSINSAKACIVLRASFTRATLQAIEELYKAGNIKWNDKDDVMEIHPSLLPQVKSILQANYKDVNVLNVQKQVKASKFDVLISKLDASDKNQIYKFLAKKYHPDLGGNKDTMALINLVFKGGD